MALPARRIRNDRGSTEVAIAAPLLLLLLMTVAQIAVWAHGHQVAETIATHGLAATRAADASERSGQAQAEQAAEQLSGKLLTDLAVTTQRSTTTAQIRVEARVPSLVPGTSWPVTHELSAPVERIPEAGAGP
ncbi:TadE-like protein [Haloactinospora alba]|uniref:TadE-like protein n=1 Tax=Haloactinospora alba TaxID=405555 RepID=A0A543NLI1_9ACTN|nr:pilus assembly protein [Haloactinospora alba]TQN32664.1 TadE-like protein [Haloactinospora alba]